MAEHTPDRCLLDQSLLQEVHDAVLRIEGDLRLGNKRMTDLESSQDETKITLYGNGKPGLVQGVNELLVEHKFRAKAAWLIAGAGIPIILTGVAIAAIWIIKKMP